MWLLRHVRALHSASSFLSRNTQCSALLRNCNLSRDFCTAMIQSSLNQKLSNLETSLFLTENTEKFKCVNEYKKSIAAETLTVVNEKMNGGEVPDSASFCSFLRVSNDLLDHSKRASFYISSWILTNRFFYNSVARLVRNKASTHSFNNSKSTVIIP